MGLQSALCCVVCSSCCIHFCLASPVCSGAVGPSISIEMAVQVCPTLAHLLEGAHASQTPSPARARPVACTGPSLPHPPGLYPQV